MVGRSVGGMRSITHQLTPPLSPPLILHLTHPPARTHEETPSLSLTHHTAHNTTTGGREQAQPVGHHPLSRGRPIGCVLGMNIYIYIYIHTYIYLCMCVYIHMCNIIYIIFRDGYAADYFKQTQKITPTPNSCIHSATTTHHHHHQQQQQQHVYLISSMCRAR
jgi:type IV secretory pathway VirB3-like protein